VRPKRFLQHVPEHRGGAPVSAIKVLLICPSESGILAGMLRAGNCAVRTTNSFREACGELSSDGNPVVICERSLPDGDWKDLVGKTPRLIVTSHAADEALWAEVLNLGGYDVLAQPFDEQEVRRVVAMARRVPERPEHLLSSPIL
jgi:DNA-binding response OmpR family regulator